MKQKYKRLISLICIFVLLYIAFFWILNAFKTSLIYYVNTKELNENHINKTIRVGGKVTNGSWDKSLKTFVLGDTLKVFYKEQPPFLFQESEEAVVEGMYDGQKLTATRIFAKHDENYFPKETVEKLKASGQWKKKI